jgi:hypothetical protein
MSLQVFILVYSFFVVGRGGGVLVCVLHNQEAEQKGQSTKTSNFFQCFSNCALFLMEPG